MAQAAVVRLRACRSSSTRGCTSRGRRRSRTPGDGRTPITRRSGTRSRRRAHPGTTGWSGPCCGRSPRGGPRTCSARPWPSRDAEAGGRRSPTCSRRAVAVRSTPCCSRARTSTGPTRRTAPHWTTPWRDERVTLVLTATAPMHRWCSGWQTLVKHGLAQYPADAARHIVEFAALRAGRLAELVDLIPASSCIVRLVRNSPPEPDLAADLAAAVGLPEPGAPPHCPSATRRWAPTPRSCSGSTARTWLSAPTAPGASSWSGSVAPASPTGTHQGSRSGTPSRTRYSRPRRSRPPGWPASTPCSTPTACSRPGPTRPCRSGTARSARREAVVPELEGAEDRETQLWRARQQRAAYRKGLLRLGR